MLFASQAYLAALNALLAEHDLGFIELVQENPFAAKLKEGVISAFRAGTRVRFEDDSWIARFNHSDRLLQLNFVAMGFNELGERPMLAGEDWQPVQNPMVIRNIEGKVDKANRYLHRRHGKVVRLRNSKLAITDWGIADLSDRPPPHSTGAHSPSVHFMSELPHPDFNKPVDVVPLGSLLLMYYENVRTIGQVTVGGPALFKFPQVAVVVDEPKQPHFIVRVEESAFGTAMLGVVHPSGSHSNYGPFSRTNRSAFIRKVGEVLSAMTQR